MYDWFLCVAVLCLRNVAIIALIKRGVKEVGRLLCVVKEMCVFMHVCLIIV